jgi:REP element-mobilizing transposase RayT
MRSRQRNNYEAYGDVFFCTSTVVGFVELFDNKYICDIFVEDIAYYQKRGDFSVISYIIMPNHFHLVIKPNRKLSISTVIGNLKRISSRHITRWLEKNNERIIMTQLAEYATQEPAKNCRVWKPRFDSFVITNESTLRQKIEYIHNNPVRAGLVFQPTDWRYSSAGNYARLNNNKLDVDIEWRSLSSGRGS